MLTRLLPAIAFMAAATIVTSAEPAQAAPGNCPGGTTKVEAPDGGTYICIAATDSGQPSASGPAEPSESGAGGCQRADGALIPCVNDWGSWFPQHQCYAHPVNVARDHDAWRGRTDGSVWMCALIVDSVDPPNVFWVPPGEAPGLPDPEELAQSAVGLLPLVTAQVRTAPLDPDPTYVGVENWLWVPESQWATLTKTVTAGDTSVTVTAEPDRVLWEMGPETKTCYGAGREWRSGMSDAATTTCGYTYAVTSASQPDGAFALSAAIRYQVDWVCTGACTSSTGTLGLVDAPAGTGALQVMQRQTVVVQ